MYRGCREQCCGGQYVDPAGSDSNNGGSPTSAWKTMAKVRAGYSSRRHPSTGSAADCETLTPQSSGTASEPITTTAYGTGALPIINGSNLVTGWSVYTGSIYSAALSTAPYNVHSDRLPGFGLVQASSLSKMSVGSWYYASGKLYVWFSANGNSSAHQIEAAVRRNGIYINGAASNNNSIQPVTLQFTAGKNTGSAGTATGNLNFITITNIITERTGIYGIQYYMSDAPTVTSCTLTQNGTGRQDLGYYNALMANIAPNALYENSTVSYGGGHAVQMQRADGGKILNRNDSYWDHSGIDVKLSSNTRVEGNTVHDSVIGSGLYTEYVVNYNADENIIYNSPMGIQPKLRTRQRSVRTWASLRE
jgi:hypothetical protein